MKQKVRNQATREVEGGQDYAEWMENAQDTSNKENKTREHIQANPDNATESAGYWSVDEATQEVQRRVRLMMERAKQVLTERQYNAFILVDVKHLNLREAAKVMEINFTRVDQLIKRARLKLQKVYKETEDA